MYQTTSRCPHYLLRDDVKDLGPQVDGSQLLGAWQNKVQTFHRPFLFVPSNFHSLPVHVYITWAFISSFWQPTQTKDNGPLVLLNNLNKEPTPVPHIRIFKANEIISIIIYNCASILMLTLKQRQRETGKVMRTRATDATVKKIEQKSRPWQHGAGAWDGEGETDVSMDHICWDNSQIHNYTMIVC